VIEVRGSAGRASATLRATPGALVVALPGHPDIPVPLGDGGVTEAVVAPTGPAGGRAVELRDSGGRALLVLSEDAWPPETVAELLATAGIRRRDYTRRATVSGTEPLVLWPQLDPGRPDARLRAVQALAAAPAGVVALVGAVRTQADEGYGPGSPGWPTDGWLLGAALLAVVAVVAGLLRWRRTPDRRDVIGHLGQTGVVALVLLGVSLQREATAPAVIAGAAAAAAVGTALIGWSRLRRHGEPGSGERGRPERPTAP
jgi:hypothetical protein